MNFGSCHTFGIMLLLITVTVKVNETNWECFLLENVRFPQKKTENETQLFSNTDLIYSAYSHHLQRKKSALTLYMYTF